MLVLGFTYLFGCFFFFSIVAGECGVGFYAANTTDGEIVCLQCRDNCVDCTSAYRCRVCKDGYSTFGFTCHKCSGNCRSCGLPDQCLICLHGYWGPKCNETCSHNCAKNMCKRDTGACKFGCRSGFFNNSSSGECTKCPDICSECLSATQCSACPEGRWDVTCSQQCSALCRGRTCHLSNGTCVKGCEAGYLQSGSGHCESCNMTCTSCNITSDCSVCSPYKECSEWCRQEHCGVSEERNDGDGFPVTLILVCSGFGMLLLVTIVISYHCRRARLR